MTNKGKVAQTVVTTETTTDYVNISNGDALCRAIMETLTLFNFGMVLYIIYYDIPRKRSKKDCVSNR